MFAHAGGEVGRVEFGVCGEVAHAVAAAVVQLGEFDAVPVTDLRQQLDEPVEGSEVGLDRGDLRAQVAVQAGGLKAGLLQDTADGLGRVAALDLEAELLPVDAGAHGRVVAGGDAGHDTHQHPLGCVRGGQCGEPGDLGEARR